MPIIHIFERNRSYAVCIFMKFSRIRFSILVIAVLFIFAGCSKENKSSDLPTIVPVANDISPSEKEPEQNYNNETVAIDNESQVDDESQVTDNTSGTTDTTADSSESESNPLSSDPEPDDTDKPVILVLDPGHGGKFTGAMYSGRVEKDMTFYVANCIKDYLLNNYEGIEVYLTRDSDIALDEDLVKELEMRAIIAKGYNADYFVSLHFNACDEHTQNGASIYASRRSNVTETSYALAKSVLTELVKIGLRDNGIGLKASSDHFDTDGSPLDYYAVLRHNAARDIPAIIVEHCFMDNTIDQAFIDSDEKLKALAEADAKGIAKFLELSSKVSE